MDQIRRKINLKLIVLVIILTVATISLISCGTNETNLENQDQSGTEKEQVVSNTEVETKEEIVKELKRIEPPPGYKLEVAKEQLGENLDLDISLEEIAAEESDIERVSDNEDVFNISIANGSGVSGIARKTAELFKKIKYPGDVNKYNITHITNADNFNYENTQIICKSEDILLEKAAEDIKTILKTGTITTSNEVFKDTDIAIIIGKDFSLPTDVEMKTVTTEKSIEELKEELKIIKEQLEDREVIIEELTTELEIAESRLEEKTESSVEEKRSVNLQNSIIVEYELQDIYYNERKVVVWVRNNSNKNFSGYIECEFYNHKGELIWQDWSSPTWDFEVNIPAGLNNYCIMFIPIEKGYPSKLQYVIRNPNFY